MDDLKAKQKVIEKIKSSANILVTVSDNPTVDALSAAIGLTLLFEKLGKYGTAIFSGVTPPAIAFLEPQKVLDSTTDSLRDFIIALDKEKADHLRYKVEGDAVKIFITPYKTTITSKDLEFSQGDYNVELVIALGVDNQEHLDKALEAHGQIFHDAAVITVTASDQTSSLGGIDWHDAKASSLSEMVTGLAESLKSDKDKSLIDTQIATAFMTGLVAQTERFSNRYTSPQSLTVASSLMAAGADQQLIATKLQEATEKPVEESQPEVPEEETPEETPEEAGTLRITDHEDKDEPAEPEAPAEEETTSPKPEDVSVPEETPEEEPEKPVSDFTVTHDNVTETLEEMDRRVKAEEQEKAAAAAYDALKNTELPTDPRETIAAEVQGVDALIVDDGVAPATRDPIGPDESDVQLPPPIQLAVEALDGTPSLGGTLNATSEQAADEARREEESDRNKTILSHGGSDTEAAAAATVPVMDTPFLQSQPVAPLTPTDLGLPLPPPLPDFSAPVNPFAPQPSTLPTAQPEILGDILAPETQASSPYFTPPVDINTAPNYFPPEALQPTESQASAPANPGQFKIPGQQ